MLIDDPGGRTCRPNRVPRCAATTETFTVNITVRPVKATREYALAPSRKRPKRVAKKLLKRMGYLHYATLWLPWEVALSKGDFDITITRPTKEEL